MSRSDGRDFSPPLTPEQVRRVYGSMRRRKRTRFVTELNGKQTRLDLPARFATYAEGRMVRLDASEVSEKLGPKFVVPMQARFLSVAVDDLVHMLGQRAYIGNRGFISEIAADISE